ncbi:cytochrome P450 [Cytobacillus purgationiresistens]|uniref:Cytochrome P450 n=1 Tax=Cytobacillus purgationiresistens TaxID=863449 RepID=A0ABU0AHN5_9BACI|nr:cytochrome P450 [Cytobacillus purgationiresistens]MDQ0270394.1 cytochrome P450 [Cytobacillus purgationiresistens]
MNKEVISYEDIKVFTTRSEQFHPLNWYKQMLLNEPISYNKSSKTWNAFRYDDVKRVLSDYEHFSSEGDRTTISVKFSEDNFNDSKVNFVTLDPPKNRRGRALLAAAFTPRSLANWEPRIHQVANNLLDQLGDEELIDVVDGISNPLLTIVMSDLLGLPSPDIALFKSWVDILFLPYKKENQEIINQRKNMAIREFFTYLLPIIMEKRKNPGVDIISDLIKAEVDGEKLTDQEIVEMTMAILGAGVETTSHMISTTFYSLLYDDAKLYSELRSNPDLIPAAVEEMLRYRFHMSRRDRTVKKDNNLLGVDLKKGDVIVAWMSAANMDQNMFSDPFTLNIHRPNNKKHLTFGNGPHFCLGAPLARLELKIILTNFLQRYSRIESVESFELEKNLTDSATGQSLTHLPLKAYK